MKNLPFYELKNPFEKKPPHQLIEYLREIDAKMNEDKEAEIFNPLLEFQRQQVVDAFHKGMKAEGEKINPRSARTAWWYAEVVDPYKVRTPKEMEKYSCVGRTSFAMCKRRRIWVAAYDLPRSTYEQLFTAQEPRGCNSIEPMTEDDLYSFP